MTLSYIVLKDIFELEVFYVELPEPTYAREKDNNIYKLTPHYTTLPVRNLFKITES